VGRIESGSYGYGYGGHENEVTVLLFPFCELRKLLINLRKSLSVGLSCCLAIKFAHFFSSPTSGENLRSQIMETNESKN
jgi:hypothetical protein